MPNAGSYGWKLNPIGGLPATVPSASVGGAGPIPPVGAAAAATAATGGGIAGPISGVITGVTGTLQNLINSFLSAPPQYFYTVPFPNNAPCLYQIKLYPRLDLYNSGAPAIGDEFVYTFPLTPSSISYQSMNMVAYYDVRGDSKVFGVQRIVDIYGQSPPVISIAGTTGFQFHSLDGFKWSGRVSMYRLQRIINTYQSIYSAAVQADDMAGVPVLTFLDGFTSSIYEVVPVGPFVDSMDAGRPILKNYAIQLAVVKNLDQPVLEDIDPLSLALIQLEGTILVAVRDIISTVEGFLPKLILGSTGVFSPNPPFPGLTGP